MSFALERVKSIAHDVVREYQPGMQVIAVTRAEGGVDSAELLVAPAGIGTPAGLVSIHVSRGGTDQDLRGSIADGLVRHFGRVPHARRAG